jgi:hypothetical protein
MKVTVPYKARLSTEIGKLRRLDVKMSDPVSDPDPPNPDSIVQKVPAPNFSGSTEKVREVTPGTLQILYIPIFET